MEYKKFNPVISDPISENVIKLSEIFPSVVKDGEVDFEALKAELGEYTEVGNEEYSLHWSGKSEALKILREKIVGKTLKYYPEESSNPETTENIYIEGDNLEALRLLQDSYRGKVKLIYIDPPYNTGKDFVFNDDFSQSKLESDKAEGKVSETGERYQLNLPTSARYHAKWLSMMYPRLRLAKDLLSKDGVILISIDDYEMVNLKEIADEIFLPENFIAELIWKKKAGGGADAIHVAVDHEYILVYAKSKLAQKKWFMPLTEEQRKEFKYTDKNFELYGPYKPKNLYQSGIDDNRPNLRYPITCPDGSVVYPPTIWRWSKERFEKALSEDRIEFKQSKNGEWTVNTKMYLYPPCDEDEDDEEPEITEYEVKPRSILPKDVGYTRDGNTEIKKLFGDKYFSYPKPSSLLYHLINVLSNPDSIIMDFFSGSATTAHAVMQLNADDGGTRKFILVQLDEDLNISLKYLTGKAKTATAKMVKFLTSIGKEPKLTEFGKERIRRAAAQIQTNYKKDKNLDLGFKVFKVADTNIRWIAAENGTAGVSLEDALTASSKDLRDFMPSSNDLDIVYEVLLHQFEIPLTEKIENVETIGKRTYSIANTIIVCLEENVTDDIIDKIAAIEPVPQKIVFRDSAFNNDISLKENAMLRLDALMQKHVFEGKQPYSVEFL